MSYSGIPQVDTTIEIIVGGKHMQFTKKEYLKYCDNMYAFSKKVYGN